MKVLLLVLVAVSLTACGNISRGVANITGNSIECVQGVQYIQFPSGVTVMYNQDGSIKTCGK